MNTFRYKANSSKDSISLSLTSDDIKRNNKNNTEDEKIILNSRNTEYLILKEQIITQSIKVRNENNNLCKILKLIRRLSKKRGMQKTERRIITGMIFFLVLSISYIKYKLI